MEIRVSISVEIMVRAPGQNILANRLPILLSKAIFYMSCKFDAKMGKGLTLFRPFISKILSTASSKYGLQPIPYTVSVGYTITPPVFTIDAHFKVCPLLQHL